MRVRPATTVPKRKAVLVLLAAAPLALLAVGTPIGPPLEGETARATMRDPDGDDVGWVAFEETPEGTLVHAFFHALPPGAHGFHLHAVGRCEPDFGAAGGHFAPAGHEHGFRNPAGPHRGDLPNLFVPAAGNVETEHYVPGLRLGPGVGALLDDDGAAVIIHLGPDDYRTDPAGNAGKRIACGVVER
jgi:Cu-Zn family superoxide dismutase